MPLTQNIKAPLFVVNDIFDRTINLEHYQERKVLIAFFRHAGCPFCNLRVHNLMKFHQELKDKGLDMIFFFESPQRVITRSQFHREVSPVPIVADPQKIWYKAYGLEPSLGKSVASHLTSFVQTVLEAKKAGTPIHPMAAGESFSTMPAEFLLGRGLLIKKMLYSEKLGERMDPSDILAFASAPD